MMYKANYYPNTSSRKVWNFGFWALVNPWIYKLPKIPQSNKKFLTHETIPLGKFLNLPILEIFQFKKKSSQN